LRIHMCSLGWPLMYDNFYPVLQDKCEDNYQQPLQLLAKTLEFIDPVTQRQHQFDAGECLSLALFSSN